MWAMEISMQRYSALELYDKIFYNELKNAGIWLFPTYDL